MIIWTLRANLFIQAFTFVTSILIARILGPTGRGELALVLLYPQLVSGIVFMGVDRSVAVLAGRGEIQRPLSTAVKLVMIYSVPAILLGYATISWRIADEHIAELAKIYLIYVPAVYLFMLVTSVLNGVGDFAKYNAGRLWFYIINLAFNLLVWLIRPSGLPLLDWVVIASMVSVYGAMVVSFWMWHSAGHGSVTDHALPPSGDMSRVLKLSVTFALPVALSQVSSYGYQIGLQHLSDARTLGLFVVLLSYSRLLSPAGSAVSTHIFRMGITGEEKDIPRLFRLSMVIYLLAALPLLAAAKFLIPLVFGREFVVEPMTVAVLLLATVAAMLAEMLAEYLKGRRTVAADIVSRVLYLTLLAVVSIALVPGIGSLGMAIAMAVGEVIRCGYLAYRVAAQTQDTPAAFLVITRHDVLEIVELGKKYSKYFVRFGK